MHRLSHTVSHILLRRSTITALIIVLAMLGLAYFLSLQLDSIWHGQLERRLVAQVHTLARQPAVIAALDIPDTGQSTPERHNPQETALHLRQAAALLGGHITVLDAQGIVLVDTSGQESLGTDLSRLPEVRAAITGDTGINLRHPTEATSVDNNGATSYMYHIAAAITRADVTTPGTTPVDETPLGIVRLTVPYAPLATDLRPLQLMIVAAGLATTLVMVALVVWIAERRAWQMRRLTEFAGHIAAGDPDAPRLLSIARGELMELAHALNRAADRLKSQTKKRAREKDRLITIMHVMNDGVVILNKNGRVRLLNPAAERILNTTHERAAGRSFMQTARDHRIAEVWERCRKTGHDEIATVELSNNQFVRVIVTPFLKRKARGYLVILQDLTEVRRLQTIRQDFVSNVSHELRTPLASLRALVETLRDGAIDDPPAAERFLDRMEVEVDALTQMVAELLELSRIESGQVPLRLAVCKPSKVLGIGAERLRPQTERAEITLTVDIPADLPEILIDSARIQQVVTNLVHNAIKFTPPGGTIRVAAYTQTADWENMASGGSASSTLRTPIHPKSAATPRVVVQIADTGMGIQENELARIFERFYKTDRSRAMGGTGLGLAISKHIIQAHGGEIWAQSDGRAGSAFYFALPFAEHVTAQNLTVQNLTTQNLTGTPASTPTQDFPPLHAELAGNQKNDASQLEN